MANYTLIEVSNVTQDGRLVFQGAVVYSTNSTGVLSFLDNTVSIFRGEGDIATGDFTSTEGNGNRYVTEPHEGRNRV